MRFTYLPLIALVFLYGFDLMAQQKKPLDFEKHYSWKSLSNVVYTENGSWLAYTIKPLEGDPKVFFINDNNLAVDSFERAKGVKFQAAGKYAAFSITNSKDSIRSLKLDKVSKQKWPKDSLAIFRLTDSLAIEKVADVKSFKIPEAGEWMAYLSEENLKEEAETQKPKRRWLILPPKEEEKVETSSKGTALHLYHPLSGEKQSLANVTEFEWSEDGAFLLIQTHEKVADNEFHELLLARINDQEIAIDTVINDTNITDIKHLVFDKAATQFTFLASKDTVEKDKIYDLYHSTTLSIQANLRIDSTISGMPENHTVSAYRKPVFSDNGQRIIVGTAAIPYPDPEDTLPADEKAKLDIWHWQDHKIQPEQLKRLKEERLRTHLSVLDLTTDEFLVLGNDSLENVKIAHNGDGDYAIAYNNRAYGIERTWEYPWRYDAYRIELSDGKATKWVEGIAFGLQFHPDGKTGVYYEAKDSAWYAIAENGESNCLTCGIDDVFAADNNGAPAMPSPEGFYGFTKENTAIIFGYHHIWEVDLKGNEANAFSNGFYDAKEVRYRMLNLHKDSVYVYPELDLISAFDRKTKAEALYYPAEKGKEAVLKGDFKISYARKPTDAAHLLVRTMTLQDYPELERLYLSDLNKERLSTTNPQQKNYNWASVEMIDYTSRKGDQLSALVYKPENFSPAQQYPVIFYYYELYTDRMHNHYSPRPSASIINPVEYASNGYIVVIPDIRYETGRPGQSAYDCVMGVADKMEKEPWINSKRMGLQGQSWGGYQTAQLVTMTNRFQAASAGAPVSNMFSAYGGIRWGSGLSRMFQYEKTQSRIGTTIWEDHELYVENSPIFHLPKVETPLLIMHNDDDGAVPWYQGIELFMGLRRLQKPVWLLNYNDDAHNLMKIPNRRDLSIRLMQFFDTFLKDENPPKWIDEGVPALDKGKDYGFGY